MPPTRPPVQIRLAVAAGLLAAGCSGTEPFASLPTVEGPAVAVTPYPWLVEAPVRIAAAGPAPDPAAGAAVAQALTVEAALMRARSEALAGPVIAPPGFAPGPRGAGPSAD